MLSFRKFPGAKKFSDNRGEGEYKDFPSKLFVSHCQKIPSRNPSVFQKFSGME